MSTVQLSETTYQLLRRKAEESTRTPDQVADQLLLQQLLPKHAYIETITTISGTQAILKNTRIPVHIIIGYLHAGETPESLAEHILPHLTFAQIYDALSYYYDHREEIDQELNENTEVAGKAYLREQLGEEDYLRITGQSR